MSRRPTARKPGLVGCFFVLGITAAALYVLGFERTRRFMCARCTGVPLGGRPAEHTALVEATRQRVALAASMLPGRMACLERSLTLYYLLRRRGVGVSFCLGIAAQPFVSHAWVEYDGHPVDDTLDMVRCLTRLAVDLP